MAAHLAYGGVCGFSGVKGLELPTGILVVGCERPPNVPCGVSAGSASCPALLCMHTPSLSKPVFALATHESMGIPQSSWFIVFMSTGPHECMVKGGGNSRKYINVCA